MMIRWQRVSPRRPFQRLSPLLSNRSSSLSILNRDRYPPSNPRHDSAVDSRTCSTLPHTIPLLTSQIGRLTPIRIFLNSSRYPSFSTKSTPKSFSKSIPKSIPTSNVHHPTTLNSDDTNKPSDKELLSTVSTSFLSILPPPFQPYARLARMDKPIGTGLLLWPCYWSTAIAASPGMLPDPTLLGLFTVGAFVMRGAGCTINDMWDQDYDKHVTRTQTRPLASGELTMRQATAFLALQLSAGLGVLVSLPHTDYCFWLGAASLPLVAAYPLMKRYTHWPQLVLGLAFNWGAFVGWAATYGSLDIPVLPLYFSGVCWTIVYDTLYAHQDKQDDAKLGLKSTALFFGDNTRPILHGFSALTFAGWTCTGYALDYTSPLFYIGCALGWSHLIWQVYTADFNDPDNLAYRFRSNQQVGAIVFGSYRKGTLLAMKKRYHDYHSL